jgi:hypothetical protein
VFRKSAEKSRLESDRDIFLPLLKAIQSGVALIILLFVVFGFDDARYNTRDSVSLLIVCEA